MNYHLPIEPKEPNTKIWINGFEIKNKTAFDFNEKGSGEGKLTMELTFTSNDYSVQKYKTFMDEFIEFLNAKGY